MKILILGSSGLLGSSIVPVLSTFDHDIKLHTFSNDGQYQADLSSSKQTNLLFDNVQPDVVINLIGMTDVHLCEKLPQKSYLLNVRVLENIVDWIHRNNSKCHLIHISTDHLYDGTGPHVEDHISLMNFYAFSKYTGEVVAKNVRSTVLRTNFIGHSHNEKVSLTDWLYNSLIQGVNIRVFRDVLFSPLSVFTLSKMINKVIQSRPTGVFNLGSKQGMSKSDFAFKFAKELNLPSNLITTISVEQFDAFEAYRPKDMRMNCSKFENTLNVELPSLDEEIKYVARRYSEGI